MCFDFLLEISGKSTNQTQQIFLGNRLGLGIERNAKRNGIDMINMGCQIVISLGGIYTIVLQLAVSSDNGSEAAVPSSIPVSAVSVACSLTEYAQLSMIEKQPGHYRRR